MNKTLTLRLVKIVQVVILIILLILPFHEFLTTWLASNFGHIDLFRIWKEILLVIISPIVVYLALINNKLRHWLLRDRLVLLILLFSIIAIILGIVGYHLHHVNASALEAGLIIDLRFFLIFVFTMVITNYSDFFKKYWREILIYPAILVILFGIAQLFLPLNFLSHFGYGPHTIPAYQTVDQQSRFHRIQSTLRGANPLGAYLIVIIPIFIFFSTKRRFVRIVSSFLSLVAIFFTYSRSAYIGLLLTLGIIFYYLKFDSPKLKKETKKALYYIFTGIVLLVIALAIILRNNTTFDNIFLHSSKNSRSATSSNTVRFSDLRSNTENFIKHPLGQGVGIAGPASVHNNHPAMFAENFYIQIGQETGILGFVVFLSINIIVGYRLYLRRDDPLSLLLFASLIGLSLVNMVSHAWGDDTLSLIWWAFAGVALSPKLKGKIS
jgi:O-antigen ligase